MIHPFPNLDAIAVQKLVARLLQGERLVSLYLLESGWPRSLFVMLEEQLVCLLNALTDILHSLGTDQLPERLTLPQLGNMRLKLGTTQVLAPPAVVPFMEGDAVVVDDSSSINRPLEMAVTLVLIELKLQCLHSFYDSLSV